MKKIFFSMLTVVTFALMSFTKENSSTNLIIDTQLNRQSYRFDKVGVCVFTYSLTATNKITGETQTYWFSHSLSATSESDCRNAAYWYVRSHALRLQRELNS